MVKRSVRVLHVLGSLNPGGVENWLLQVLRSMDRDRFQFDFCTFGGKPGIYDDEVKHWLKDFAVHEVCKLYGHLGGGSREFCGRTTAISSIVTCIFFSVRLSVGPNMHEYPCASHTVAIAGTIGPTVWRAALIHG
jgi:hypothetical protein